MIGPFLRGKHAWDHGELTEAARCIDRLAGGHVGAPAVWLPEEGLGSWTQGTFEGAVARALSDDDHLIVPFADAVTRLWAQWPAQVCLHALEQRATLAGDVGERELEVVYAAAVDGVLSLDSGDRDRIGKVVLDADAYPRLSAVVDRARLAREVSAARQRDAWNAFAAAHRDVMAQLVLADVFHRSRRLHPEMAVDALNRIATQQPQLLDLAAETLGTWARTGAGTDDVVRYGMRIESGAHGCLAALLEAIAGREFEEFASDCLLD